MNGEALLKVEGLGVAFTQYTKGLKRTRLQAISDLDAELYAGEILAVVGSSGSGKSLLAHAILGILPQNAETSGRIIYDGRELKQADKEALRGRELALVPQSVNFLDPLQRVGEQIVCSADSDGRRRRMNGRKARATEAEALLARYGLDRAVAGYYPHQLSGGMARKVLLQTALSTDCRLIIADEPTPGLDEAALQEVLHDFRAAADGGRGILMITHDINAALRIADRIAIFYAGTTFEIAAAADFQGTGRALRHPYSKALLAALPDRGFTPIPGTQPLPGELPQGCLFCGRCPEETKQCRQTRPEFRGLRNGKVRCIHAT